jgi:hypothetical protein
MARRYDSSGSPQGVEFQVNTYTTWCCGYSDLWEDFDAIEVAADSAGNFMVVWNRGRDPSTVAARCFDSSGTAAGPDFEVITDPGLYYPGVGVAADGAGRFIVVWDTDSGAIDGQRFDSAGTPVGSDFRVNQSGDALTPAVAADGAGNQFGSSGTALGDEFLVNTYTDYNQWGPAVAAAPPGNFVVVWTSEYQDNPTYFDPGVFGQRFGDGPQPLVLSGRRLVISNVLPDDKERNRGKWLTKDPNIVVGTPGSGNDPRCNADPTHRARSRRASAFSVTDQRDRAPTPVPFRCPVRTGCRSHPRPAPAATSTRTGSWTMGRASVCS